MKIKTRYKQKITIDYFKLLVLDALVFINVLLESMYSEIESISRIVRIFRYLNFALMFFLVLIIKRQRQSRLVIVAIMLAFSIINYLFKNGSIGLMMALGVFLICNDLSSQKIVLHTIIASIVSYSFVIISSLFGIIENVKIVRYLSIGIWQGRYDRQALGFQFPNQIPLMLFYVAAVVIIGLKEEFKFKQAIILVAINLVVYSFCNARTPFLLVTILIVVSLLYQKCNSSKKYVCMIPLILTPILFIGSFVLTIGYKSISFIQKMDVVFNYRFSSAYLTIKHWGITLFGSGSEAGTKETDIKNSFVNGFSVNVDNGYITFLLQYGLILSIMLFGIFIVMSFRIYYYRDGYFAIAFSMILFSNIIDANLVSFKMWPIVLLCFTDYKTIDYQKLIENVITKYKKKSPQILKLYTKS